MSIVRNTVTNSLRSNGLSGYASQAEPVIRDLERGLAAALSNLKAEARRAGVSQQQVTEALIAVGLEERPAPPAPVQNNATSTNGGSASEAIARLEAEVAALKSAAQRHGVRL